VIPQRNISLLSNRRAAGGGKRIPEDVLERDYCLAWFLCCLAQSDLKAVLAFKGGTALKRCYFADYRFSEDLDFTLREPLPFEEIRGRLERVYAAVQEQSGITFAFDREDRQAHANSYTFYLRYTGPLPTASDVKVDITINELVVLPSSTVSSSGATKNSAIFRKIDRFLFIRSMKSLLRKQWHSPTLRETNLVTSMTCGTLRRMKE
jgi:hypothetical protein